MIEGAGILHGTLLTMVVSGLRQQLSTPRMLHFTSARLLQPLQASGAQVMAAGAKTAAVEAARLQAEAAQAAAQAVADAATADGSANPASREAAAAAAAACKRAAEVAATPTQGVGFPLTTQQVAFSITLTGKPLPTGQHRRGAPKPTGGSRPGPQPGPGGPQSAPTQQGPDQAQNAAYKAGRFKRARTEAPPA